MIRATLLLAALLASSPATASDPSQPFHFRGVPFGSAENLRKGNNIIKASCTVKGTDVVCMDEVAGFPAFIAYRTFNDIYFSVVIAALKKEDSFKLLDTFVSVLGKPADVTDETTFKLVWTRPGQNIAFFCEKATVSCFFAVEDIALSQPYKSAKAQTEAGL